MKKRIIYREDGKPYLIRYTIFNWGWVSLKIHNILISDYDCMHDHPWAFLTFLIKGGYVEYTPKIGQTLRQTSGWTSDESMRQQGKVYGRFSLLWRPANYIHRLEIHQPVWSIVFTFKRVRQWGFWTKLGWVHYKKYNPQNSCES